MNCSRPMTFHSLLMVLRRLTLCVANNSQAQVQVRAGEGDCSDDAPCNRSPAGSEKLNSKRCSELER